MRNDFAIFITTHERPNDQRTLDWFLKSGYTGKYYLVIDNMDKLDAKSFKLFVELLEDDTSYDNIILGAVNHDDTLEQLKGTGLKIVNL